MKALIISEDTSFVQNFSTFFKNNDIDTIVYKWLLKALDNIEEIAPDVIILNTAEYPRHWKTLVQFAKSGIGADKVCVFLYEPTPLSNEDFMKAEALDVNGAFGDLSETTMNGILAEINRFFGKAETSIETPVEEVVSESVSSDVTAPVIEEAVSEEKIEGQFILTNPSDNSFVFGNGILSGMELSCFDLNPDDYSVNQLIHKITFKNKDKDLLYKGKVFSKEADSLILHLQECYEKQ